MNSMRMPLLVDRYIAYMAGPRRASPHTVDAYRRDLKDFCTFLERLGIDAPEVDHRTLRTYLANLETRGLSRSSIRRRASVIRRFYRFCEREGVVAGNPAELLTLPKARTRLPRVLKPGEIGRLLAGAEQRLEPGERPPAPEACRDLALVALLYDAG